MSKKVHQKLHVNQFTVIVVFNPLTKMSLLLKFCIKIHSFDKTQANRNNVFWKLKHINVIHSARLY